MDQLEESYDIVVNIQGDEPLIEPEIIDKVVSTLQGAPDAVYRYGAMGSSCPAAA